MMTDVCASRSSTQEKFHTTNLIGNEVVVLLLLQRSQGSVDAIHLSARTVFRRLTF